MEKSIVSVIIPTYKREERLKKAVKSVMNQTYENIEIIVVNDDPESDINSILKERQNLKLINHDINKGGGGARNTGIKNARGKYIAFLDDDDRFLPKKIEREVKLLESLDEDWIGIYSWRYNEEGKPEGPNIEGDLTYPVLTIDPDLKMNAVLLLKKKILEKVGGFDETFDRHQDWELFMKLFEQGKIKVLKEPLWFKSSYNPPSNAEDAEKNELHFLNKFKDKIDEMPKKQRRKIWGAHYLYIIPPFIEEGNFRKAFDLFKKYLNYVPPFHHPYKYIQIAKGFYRFLLNK